MTAKHMTPQQENEIQRKLNALALFATNLFTMEELEAVRDDNVTIIGKFTVTLFGKRGPMICAAIGRPEPDEPQPPVPTPWPPE